jgi:hypothetical protein
MHHFPAKFFFRRKQTKWPSSFSKKPVSLKFLAFCSSHAIQAFSIPWFPLQSVQDQAGWLIVPQKGGNISTGKKGIIDY